jgi:phage terminase small subunit
MGRRGPKPKSATLERLQGNPGRRPILSRGDERENKVLQQALAPSPTPLIAPDFLKEPREREIFHRVIDGYLQRRIAHEVDVTAYGRWAHYVHRWLECKELLSGKLTFLKIVTNHGERYIRNPVFKDMLDIERVLLASEDRLGLNPVARHAIVRGLAQTPAALGGFFGENVAGEIEEEGKSAPGELPSPIGIGKYH